MKCPQRPNRVDFLLAHILVSTLVLMFIGTSALAASITVNNASFERPVLGSGVWTNALADPDLGGGSGPDWIGRAGQNNGNTFIEFIPNFNSQGNQHLGMQGNYYVFQNTGVAWQANTDYTLTVGVGNRNEPPGALTIIGLTNSAQSPGPNNSLPYSNANDALENDPVLAVASRTVDSGVNANLSFTDYSVSFTTGATPPTGNIVIFLGDEGSSDRSHFDNVRLDSTSGLAGVRNDTATGVGTNAATLRGTIENTGDSTPTVTIFYGDEDGGTDANAWDASVSVPGTQNGSFSTVITGLQPATVYFFTARATNSAGNSWAAPSETFETSPLAPTVANIAPTDIGATFANPGANVTSNGGDNPEVTIYYGTTDGGTNSAAWASSSALGSFSGSMEASLTGLTQSTTYFYRAFASNDGGSSWATATQSFTTIMVTAPVIENRTAQSISGTSATLRGDVKDAGGDSPTVTLYYGTTDGGMTPGAWENSISVGVQSGNFSQFVAGLSPETGYFFRAFASNAAGSAWAPASQSFNTTALVPTTVVINEIHYNPADNTSAEEFVELYNPGDTAVDVSGWRLNRGVEYTIPAGTEIAGNGYLVVAEDPPTLQSLFGVTALGPYTGGLSGKGEDVELEDNTGARIDFVNYGTGFPWPTSSDGAGSSMELLNPALDNDLGGSWRASGTLTAPPEAQILIPAGDSGWSYRRSTSEASSPTSAWRQIAFAEDGSWQTGTTVIGYGDGDDVTVISGMEDVHWGMYLRKSFTVDPLQIPSQLQLNVYVDDGCIVWLNGVEVARLHVSGGSKAFDDRAENHEAEWESVQIPNAGAILGGGTNVLAIHAMNSSFSSSDFSIDAELRTPEPGNVSGVPTPGEANSVLAANAPPQIRQVDHVPSEPTSTDDVVISAKITDPDDVGPVILSYQLVDPGSYIRRSDAAYDTNWVDFPMTDDGTGGDATSGDFVFSVTMPASLHTHRRLVRYRIHFEDAVGNATTAPYEDDESPNFAYFIYDGVPAWTGANRPGSTSPETFPATLMDDMPIYHLIANSTDVTNSQYNGGSDGVHMFGTMVYDGKVYDHIAFENRGEASTYQSGKNKWRFHFNRSRDFAARDQWGKKYKSPWDEMNFDSCASPWAPLHRGMAGLDEAISYRLYALAGMASPNLHYVHFRVVDQSSEAPSDQYAGDLWGLYTAIEQPDGSFLDDRGLPDGNVYKIEGGGGDKKHQAATQPTSSSDWNSFRSSSGSTQNEAYWRANMNLDDYYTFRACNRILGNVDVREGFNHYFYNNPEGKWQVIPWDLDMMFIAETHWSGTIQQKACLNVSTLNIEFENRCRELLDLVCSDPNDDGGQIGQLIDEYADIVNPQGQDLTWSDVDQFMWNYHPRTRGSAGNASGQGNHKGNFFASPFSDSRIGGGWTRTLQSKDHEGSVEFLRNYTTDTYTGGNWSPGNGRQNGYGYEYLAREASDSRIPNKPTISYTGTNFATNDLTFSSSAFSDPQGSGTFAAIKWRIAEIANPTTPGFDPQEPRKYEVETVWKTGDLTPFSANITIPPAEIRVGLTYRVRARHKDTTGRWSHWSEPIQFVTGDPDVSVWQENLMITEVMYHPSPPSAAELAAGFTGPDFEFIELQNISANSTLDLTELRFTKGVDFDFVNGTIISLAPGAYVLVVRNIAAFEMRYGPNFPIAGAYSPDRLSNGGEQIKLSFGAGSAIRDFTYDDVAPWPTTADGEGFSLVLIDPSVMPDHTIADSWTGSGALGGTPGRAEQMGDLFRLTTATQGQGSITASPNQSSFTEGATVSLTPVPSAGWEFVNWSGDASGSSVPLTVTMDTDKSVTAVFRERFTVTTQTSGSGAVSLDPQQSDYSTGQSVTVSATPAAGYRFAGWSGDLSGSANPVDLIVDSNKSVTATFIQQFSLTATAGSGGMLTSVPDQSLFDSGSEVSLTATATAGFAFAGWSGDASGVTNPLTVTMNANKSITANFAALATLSTSTSGNGSISQSPEGSQFPIGTQVTLTALADENWQFTGWRGSLTGTANPQSITLNASASVTASFTRVYMVETSTPAGEGSIALSPAGPAFLDGSQVTAMALPADGYRFDAWGGSLTGSTNPTTLTVDSDELISASFVKQWTLTVNDVEGGTIMVSPDQSEYDHNTRVVATAIPSEGFELINWTGDITGSASPATLIMDGDKVISAVFASSASAFENWQAAHFSATELANPAISGPTADPDFDTFPNVIEFGSGTDPKNPSSSPDITAGFATDGSNVITITLERPRGIDGVAWRLELSDDLMQWNYNGDGTGKTYTEDPAVTEVADGRETITFRSLAAPDLTTVYYRLRASLVD